MNIRILTPINSSPLAQGSSCHVLSRRFPRGGLGCRQHGTALSGQLWGLGCRGSMGSMGPGKVMVSSYSCHSYVHFMWVNYNDLTVLPNPGIMVFIWEKKTIHGPTIQVSEIWFHLPRFHVGKTMPFLPAMTGNGRHTTYKNGDDLGMVRLWHCFNHITIIYQVIQGIFLLRTPILPSNIGQLILNSTKTTMLNIVSIV